MFNRFLDSKTVPTGFLKPQCAGQLANNLGETTILKLSMDVGFWRCPSPVGQIELLEFKGLEKFFRGDGVPEVIVKKLMGSTEWESFQCPICREVGTIVNLCHRLAAWAKYAVSKFFCELSKWAECCWVLRIKLANSCMCALLRSKVAAEPVVCSHVPCCVVLCMLCYHPRWYEVDPTHTMLSKLSFQTPTVERAMRLRAFHSHSQCSMHSLVAWHATRRWLFILFLPFSNTNIECVVSRTMLQRTFSAGSHSSFWFLFYMPSKIKTKHWLKSK